MEKRFVRKMKGKGDADCRDQRAHTLSRYYLQSNVHNQAQVYYSFRICIQNLTKQANENNDDGVL